MSEATEKQTAILLKNGFNQESINRMNKQAISEEIGKIFDKPKKSSPQPSNAQIGATGGISEVKHIFQNSYEFGPAGNRFNIRYWTIDDLKEQMKLLNDNGLIVEKV